jgi:hypothetical protein
VNDLSADNERGRRSAGRRAFGQRVNSSGSADLLRYSRRGRQDNDRENEKKTSASHDAFSGSFAGMFVTHPHNRNVGPAVTEKSCIVNAAMFERSARY